MYNTLIPLPSGEILWKDTVSANFRTIPSKLDRNCLSTKFPRRKLGKITVFYVAKITFLVSNSLGVAELEVNEAIESISKKISLFLFLSDLSPLNVKISRAYH